MNIKLHTEIKRWYQQNVPYQAHCVHTFIRVHKLFTTAIKKVVTFNSDIMSVSDCLDFESY